jgi:hypothetical protein
MTDLIHFVFRVATFQACTSLVAICTHAVSTMAGPPENADRSVGVVGAR